MIRVVHPGSRIRILNFYPSQIQGPKMHRIPDPDQQHSPQFSFFDLITQYSGDFLHMGWLPNRDSNPGLLNGFPRHHFLFCTLTNSFSECHYLDTDTDLAYLLVCQFSSTTFMPVCKFEIAKTIINMM
jgi:hypothetical protein